MKSLRNTFLVACATVVILWNSATDALPTTRRYCGSLLTQRISMICRNSYNDSPFRVRRGIVETCCLNPCSEKTMLSYCGFPEDDKQDSSQSDSEDNAETEDMINNILAADILYRSQQQPVFETTTEPATGTKSKLEIGRVPKDYYARGWTYAG